MAESSPASASFASELASVAALSASLAWAQLAGLALSLTDGWMMGRLGPEALAGGGLGAGLYSTMTVVVSAGLSGAAPLFAEAAARSDTTKLVTLRRDALLLAAAAALGLMCAMLASEPLLKAAGVDASVAAGASRFLRFVSPAVFPQLGASVLRQFASATGRAHRLALVSVLAVPCNAALDVLFMFGGWGLPAMGVAGAGLATSAVTWLSFLLLWGWLPSNGPASGSLARPSFGPLLALGWPVASAVALEVGAFAAVGILAGRLGVDTMAAHNIAIHVATAAFVLPLGVAQATTVRVASGLSTQGIAGARRAGGAGLLMALAGASVTILALRYQGHLVVEAFLPAAVSAADTLSLASSLLTIVAVFHLADALQTVAAGALRGLRDTRSALVAVVAAYGVVAPLAAWVLVGVLGWGLRGLWWALALGLLVAACLLGGRLMVRTIVGSGGAGGECPLRSLGAQK